MGIGSEILILQGSRLSAVTFDAKEDGSWLNVFIIIFIEMGYRLPMHTSVKVTPNDSHSYSDEPCKKSTQGHTPLQSHSDSPMLKMTDLK